MSGSVTVIGSHTGSTLTGIVTVPVSFPVGNLQTTLSNLSAAVTGGVETLYNNSVPGAVPSTAGGIYEITTGSLNTTVPSGYNTLIVSSGTDAVSGNGGVNLAVFGSNASVNYTEVSGSGSGSIFASGNDNVVVNGTSYNVVGGSIGGNAFNILSNTGAVTTTGGSNIVLIAGITDSVLSEGSNDLIAAAETFGSVTVSGFANVIGLSGSTTITAVGTGKINAFVDAGYAGKMDFINDSSSASTITGLAGTVTVFGGAGGGHYEGGALGSNSLTGGTGLVTLVGSAAGNDTLVAGGSGAGFNVINAGGQDAAGNVTTGGNDFLGSTSTAGTTYFHLNEGNDIVTVAGSGTQYVYFNGVEGNATVTASSLATKNQFYLQQASGQGGTADVISNFSLTKDNFSLINDTTHVAISKVENGQEVGGGLTGAIITLNNGSSIKLVGVSLSTAQITSIVGGTSF